MLHEQPLKNEEGAKLARNFDSEMEGEGDNLLLYTQRPEREGRNRTGQTISISQRRDNDYKYI